ncbi:MAG TPA: hypothetical protein P5546_04925 [Bacilli bacterium]|nr:hypothetical protein [Bacilli bacterium]
MKIEAVLEFNDKGYLAQACNFPGVFGRSLYKEEALGKLLEDLKVYCQWLGKDFRREIFEVVVVKEIKSDLRVEDADTDVIFDNEKEPLSPAKYQELKRLALKSAEDFLMLYNSVPDQTALLASPRKTFYGEVPRSAQAMYEHTKNVNDYYFGEIKVKVGNEPDILASREEGFKLLEENPDLLANKVFVGSYNELWSLAKVCRRFIWHDRIHAKALYRLAAKKFGEDQIANSFCFRL